jgi:uncharacterized cofD-like protein
MSSTNTNLNKKIVIIGGGTGTFNSLVGCKDFPFEITAIVSTADDGGSSGQLRDELGVLPPGDIRQALVALSDDSTGLRELFNYRFESGGLKGHQFGNLFLSALEKIKGRFDLAVDEASKILSIKGKVVPVTTDNITLMGQTKDKKVIKGQHAIDEYIWSESSPINKLWLLPKSKINPAAREAILAADLIVIGPGSIFTSLIPSLLVEGMKEAIKISKAKVVYVSNLMTEKGQTGEYCVGDYIELIEKYLGKDRINYIIYNNIKPSKYLLNRYRQEMERVPVVLGEMETKNKDYMLIGADLLSKDKPKFLSRADKLSKTRSLIRHDGRKLAEILFYISLGDKFDDLNIKRL